MPTRMVGIPMVYSGCPGHHRLVGSRCRGRKPVQEAVRPPFLA